MTKFVGLRNERVNEALERMGINVRLCQRVIIDLSWDEMARVYVIQAAETEPVAELLEHLAPFELVTADGVFEH